MLKARLENVRKTEIGPLIELNIYNGDKLEYGAAIIPDGGYQFTCYRMECHSVTQSAIGSSGMMNYDKLAMSKLTVKEKKAVLHGEIVLAATDFIGVISDLFSEDIECPYGLSRRFMTDALEDYINMCYKYLMYEPFTTKTTKKIKGE